MQKNHLLEPLRAALEGAVSMLSEYELICLLQKQGWLSPIASADNVALYSTHFLVYNGLYQLRDDYQAQTPSRHLYISALNIGLMDKGNHTPEAGSANTVSTERSDDQADIAALREYYLDWRHLESATQASVEHLLNSFWSKLVDDDEYTKALSILEVSANDDEAYIKRRYRQLAMKYHPDRGGDQARFQEIQWAFSVVQRLN